MRWLLILFLLAVLAFSIDMDPFAVEQIRTSGIQVTIEGEVEYPGIYTLEPYTELQDLLDLAGTKETADLDVLNPQTVLKDGDCVIIRAKDRPAGRVSINTGTLEDLCTLPGIGETTAAKIIEYRETNGYYQTLEDIKKVKGIGDKKYANIEDLICL